MTVVGDQISGASEETEPHPHPRDGAHQSGRKAKNKAEVFWEVEMRRWADGLDGKTKRGVLRLMPGFWF